MDWNGIERRKSNRLPDNNFTPNGAFEGYVYAKLEDTGRRLNALPCNETFMRLNKVENDVANMRGKATVFGAITGFVAGLASKIFFGK
jgi:hypothetical protein